jgi:dihydroorotate dehydrogenase electron transfer subunit
MLANKKSGDSIDLLGPLGNGFDFDGDFGNALIVAGGLGSAPFPLLTKYLKDKDITSFVGGRSLTDVIKYGMKNVVSSTDDGSLGFKGTVVELLESRLDRFNPAETRIFSCGPNPMLRALKVLATGRGFECQASTECAMACGFGICQGCPIESSDKSKYYLVCKDGPVFNVKDVTI